MCLVPCRVRLQTAGELLFECGWRGWGLSPPPSHQTLSSLPFLSRLPSLRSDPVPGAEIRAPSPYLECRSEPTVAAPAAGGPCPAAAPLRGLPAPLSLAPGRRQLCGPGGSSQRFAKERVSSRCVGHPPPPTFLKNFLYQDAPARGRGAGSALTHAGRGHSSPQTAWVQIPHLSLPAMGPWARALTPRIKTCHEGKYVPIIR